MQDIDTHAIIIIEKYGNDYHEFELTDLDFFSGEMPAFGDRVTLLAPEDGYAIFEVIGRYPTTHVDDNNATEWRPWVIVIEQIEPDDFSGIERLIRDIRHREHPEGADTVAEIEEPEEIDRDNRDPAYWTFERKEILRKEREARLAAMKAREKD